MAEEFEHGLRAYKRGWCRCEICRAANSQRVLLERDRRYQSLRDDPTSQPHGVFRTYFYFGCRCFKCLVEAASPRNDRLMKRGEWGRTYARTPEQKEKKRLRTRKGQNLQSKRLMHYEKPITHAKPFGRD